MAIACEACTRPVHETAVTCPHCGGATGVRPDPSAVDTRAPKRVAIAPAAIFDDAGHPIVEAVIALAAAVIDATAGPVEDATELPTAIARERPRRLEPRPSTEPPEPPGAPDEPRLLK